MYFFIMHNRNQPSLSFQTNLTPPLLNAPHLRVNCSPLPHSLSHKTWTTRTSTPPSLSLSLLGQQLTKTKKFLSLFLSRFWIFHALFLWANSSALAFRNPRFAPILIHRYFFSFFTDSFLFSLFYETRFFKIFASFGHFLLLRSVPLVLSKIVIYFQIS